MSKVIVEKLIFGGQALAHDAGKPVFLWNALPGETVEYEVLKKRKGIIEAVATQIISPSADRIAPKENHYLCCSPWEIITPKAEATWKQTIALETYRKIGGLTIAPEDCPIISGAEQYGYRNKIEFSFLTLPSNKLSLAFYHRGTHTLVPLPNGCALATPAINQTAQTIRAWLESENVHGKITKSVIVRSNEKGETAAAVFLKYPPKFKEFPALEGNWRGFHVYRSNPQSPAATPDELIYSAGDNFLETTIGDLRFKYGLLSFFQINVPIFNKALQDIKKHMAQSSKILDYYSGVGAIGLALAKQGSSVKLIEINKEANQYAQENILTNHLKNMEAILSPSEKVLDYIEPDATVVVDPPRAGLHPDFTERLLSVVPEKIIYLSCDLATQARDLKLLSAKYRPVFHSLYNFFPRTPHLEALCVLECIK